VTDSGKFSRRHLAHYTAQFIAQFISFELPLMKFLGGGGKGLLSEREREKGEDWIGNLVI